MKNNENTTENFDDEISISDIISKIWSGRGIVAVLTVLGCLSGLGISLLFSAVSQPAMQYGITLTGMQAGKYPNGTEFSPQDLLHPDVMSEVGRQANIGDLNALRDALTVESGSFRTAAIERKFRDLLDTSSLSAAQIDQINERFTDELNSDNRNNVIVYLDYRSVGLDAIGAERLLVSVPQIWSDVYKERFTTVLDPDIKQVRIGGSLADRNVSTIVEVDVALADVSSALLAMADDPRLRSIESGEGQTPASLLGEVEQYRQLYLLPIIAAEIANDVPEAVAYLGAARLELDSTRTRLDGLSAALDRVRGAMGGQDTGDSVAGQLRSGVEVAGSAVESIVGLANRAELAELLRELTEREQDLVDELVQVERNLNRFVRAQPAAEYSIMTRVEGAEQLLSRYTELYDAALLRLDSEYPRFFSPLRPPDGSPGYIFPLFLQLVLGATFIGFVVGATLSLTREKKEKSGAEA